MTPGHLGSNLPQANGPYGHGGQMGMQQHGPPPMRVSSSFSYDASVLCTSRCLNLHDMSALASCKGTADPQMALHFWQHILRSSWCAQMGGGGNMMMNSGMIPIGAHAPSGASPMVPVGGMPQNNRHMNPAMQGDYGGVRQSYLFCFLIKQSILAPSRMLWKAATRTFSMTFSGCYVQVRMPV